MELLEFKQKMKDLLKYDECSEINDILLKNANNKEFVEKYIEIINNDFSTDWLQRLYQYELADRKNKKQDYTPISLSKLVAKLVGKADIYIDMCAGSGSLTLQCFKQNKDAKYNLLEIDENVIGFLIFNMVIRNIAGNVSVYDVINKNLIKEYKIVKGEKYGSVVNK